ncbi:copper homeostasis protein CutC [Aureibaculum sp. A20]|uniref:PF03932 family protein CutC n=1 Tax=Aureibaculum flavum TaxID=2795986 RepID=A0ABS0WWL8_9FLAO|nr:copper homeostasis protein CutC [Aureibaculum flavum]MBJ2176383.1 copper homeostasis protein CutC [Aureibaculum flavum]
MKIEICANSYQSAVNAEASGADRIELCSELAVGGITPSYGLIIKIKQDLRIPVHVLIRPRSGDFTYSNADFEVMKQDIVLCKNLGCEGVVSGVLNTDNTIDLERTKELIELARPMSFTFHRAFDWVVNPLKSLDELKAIGVNRILTSGQENQAIKGIELLKKLKVRAGTFIEIMPGSGVNIDTILEFKKAGFNQVHFSATSLYRSQKKVHVTMNSDRFFDDTILAISDSEKIVSMINLVK